jgi:hypothetical protein
MVAYLSKSSSSFESKLSDILPGRFPQALARNALQTHGCYGDEANRRSGQLGRSENDGRGHGGQVWRQDSCPLRLRGRGNGHPRQIEESVR